MSDALIQTIFFIFAGLAVISAVIVVTEKNPVKCVLSLVITFFSSSVLWIIAGAEFLGLILVLVYVGAVMTLFLFVVMMLNTDVEEGVVHQYRSVPFAILIMAGFVAVLIMALPATGFNPQALIPVGHAATGSATNLTNTMMIGMELFTGYLAAFEMAAVILLVAIVAAVTLVHRERVGNKRQNIRQQIMTRRDERVTLVSMNAEKNG